MWPGQDVPDRLNLMRILCTSVYKIPYGNIISPEGVIKPVEEFEPGDDLYDADKGVRYPLARREGMTEEQLKLLMQGRTHPRVVGAVRMLKDRAAAQGVIKVVMVPREVKFDLKMNKGGEVIKEDARTWR